MKKKRWYTQAEVDDEVRRDVAKELSRQIAGYDGSAARAKEILRGLAAARMMDMDCRPFEDALVERHRVLSDAA
jgi:hypothetical protein